MENTNKNPQSNNVKQNNNTHSESINQITSLQDKLWREIDKEGSTPSNQKLSEYIKQCILLQEEMKREMGREISPPAIPTPLEQRPTIPLEQHPPITSQQARVAPVLTHSQNMISVSHSQSVVRSNLELMKYESLPHTGLPSWSDILREAPVKEVDESGPHYKARVEEYRLKVREESSYVSFRNKKDGLSSKQNFWKCLEIYHNSLKGKPS